jgi:hypothetical protein
MSRAHYPAQSAHNTEKHPAHYPEQNTKPGSLKAIAGAVLKRSSVMCECADPRNAHSHITSDNCTLPRTMPAHCNNDTHHPEGWCIDQDMPSRAVHMHNGRLIDSCLLRTAGGAENFLHRVAVGEPPTFAFSAACAFEDAQQPNPHTQRRI